MRAQVDGKLVLAGNARLMQAEKIHFAQLQEAGTVVYVAQGGQFIGAVLISDTVKPEAKAAIASLRKAGIRKTVMSLSGSMGGSRQAKNTLRIP